MSRGRTSAQSLRHAVAQNLHATAGKSLDIGGFSRTRKRVATDRECSLQATCDERFKRLKLIGRYIEKCNLAKLGRKTYVLQLIACKEKAAQRGERRKIRNILD